MQKQYDYAFRDTNPPPVETQDAILVVFAPGVDGARIAAWVAALQAKGVVDKAFQQSFDAASTYPVLYCP